MNCRDALLHLYEYLDKELTDDVVRKIEAHLTICEHCLDKYEFEKMLQAVIAKKGQVEVDAEPLKAKVLQRIADIDKDERSGGFFSRFRPYLAAAVAVAVVVLSLITSLDHSESDVYAALSPFVNNHMETLVSADKLPETGEEAAETHTPDDILGIPDDMLRETDGRLPKDIFPDKCSDRDAKHIVYDYLGKSISVYVILDSTFAPCPNLKVKREDHHTYHYGSLDGMNVIMWRCNNVWCVAVADTEVKDLMQFASAY